MTQREPLMDAAYFDKLLAWHERSAARFEETLKRPDTVKPGLLLHRLFSMSYQSLVARYSRGDPLSELAAAFPPIVAAWERSLGSPGAEAVSLADIDDYVVSLWLVSLALLLEIDTPFFDRLLRCIGNAGGDELLERLVATRVAGRPPAKQLLFPRPYETLVAAIDAESAEQPKLMQRFLKTWYKSPLRRCYWHENHTGPEGGGFFGYWCLEAAGVAHAFGIDDRSFRDLPYYPKDLVAHSL